MKKSTKRLSYEQFQTEHGSTVAHKIYRFLREQNTALSRQQIANEMGIRLSTVCGQIHPMLDAGLVVTQGTTTDPDSGRKVELIFAV
jgi:predicted transcriptional regulator